MNADKTCLLSTSEMGVASGSRHLLSRQLGLSRYVHNLGSKHLQLLTFHQELVLRVDRIESGELTVDQTLKVEL